MKYPDPDENYLNRVRGAFKEAELSEFVPEFDSLFSSGEPPDIDWEDTSIRWAAR